jgi:hypothetical protein
MAEINYERIVLSYNGSSNSSILDTKSRQIYLSFQSELPGSQLYAEKILKLKATSVIEDSKRVLSKNKTAIKFTPPKTPKVKIGKCPSF